MSCLHKNTLQRISGPHLGEYCDDCGLWLRWVPKKIENWRTFVMPFGKYAGQTFEEISLTDPGYIRWASTTPGVGSCIHRHAIAAMSEINNA